VDRKIRIGAVSYLNTKPLIYGLKDGHINNEMELVMDYPAKIAQMILEDEIEMQPTFSETACSLIQGLLEKKVRLLPYL
jgi:predicted solute-binding protein